MPFHFCQDELLAFFGFLGTAPYLWLKVRSFFCRRGSCDR